MSNAKLSKAQWAEATMSGLFTAGALAIVVAFASPMLLGRELGFRDIDVIAACLLPLSLAGWLLQMRRRNRKRHSKTY